MAQSKQLSQKVDVPEIDAWPLLDSRGFVVLFDLWVGGKWIDHAERLNNASDVFRIYAARPSEPW